MLRWRASQLRRCYSICASACSTNTLCAVTWPTLIISCSSWLCWTICVGFSLSLLLHRFQFFTLLLKLYYSYVLVHTFNAYVTYLWNSDGKYKHMYIRPFFYPLIDGYSPKLYDRIADTESGNRSRWPHDGYHDRSTGTNRSMQMDMDYHPSEIDTFSNALTYA